MLFEIPLLDCQKTHGRLQTPYWTEYLSTNFNTHGKITEIKTDKGCFKFISASANAIFRAGLGDTGLDSLAGWVQSGNYKRNIYGGPKKGYSSDETMEWICLPNGRWVVTISTFIACHSTRLLSDLKTPDGSLFDIMVQTGQDFEYRNYADNLIEIRSSWDKQWKKSRQAWKRQERKNGGLKASQEQKVIDDAIEVELAEDATMEHIAHLILLLQNQFTAIVRNEVTVEKVGEIFNATNELTSRHYRLKKALKLQ